MDVKITIEFSEKDVQFPKLKKEAKATFELDIIRSIQDIHGMDASQEIASLLMLELQGELQESIAEGIIFIRDM